MTSFFSAIARTKFKKKVLPEPYSPITIQSRSRCCRQSAPRRARAKLFYAAYLNQVLSGTRNYAGAERLDQCIAVLGANGAHSGNCSRSSWLISIGSSLRERGIKHV